MFIFIPIVSKIFFHFSMFFASTEENYSFVYLCSPLILLNLVFKLQSDYEQKVSFSLLFTDLYKLFHFVPDCIYYNF